MCSKSWLERKDEMLQTEKKHYEEYRGCNEYHTEHIVAGPNLILELIALFVRTFPRRQPSESWLTIPFTIKPG